MSDVVVIATSLDEGNLHVLETGLGYARRIGARVAVVHSLESESGQPRYGGLPSLDVLVAEKEEKLREQLETTGAESSELAEVEVTVGRACDVIGEAVRRHGAALAVLGATRGRSSKLFGSTAERMMNTAPCALLVVRGEPRVPPRKVLAPVDLSELSADSVRVGLELLDRVSEDVPWELRVLVVEEDGEIEEIRRDELASFVASACECESATVDPAIRVGDVAETILDDADAWGAELLLLGTHGTGGYDRLRAGSVASKISEESPASVLLVPPILSLGRGIEAAVIQQTRPDRFREE